MAICDLSGINLLELIKLEKLKRLDVKYCRLTQQQIDEISTINNLEELILGCDLSDLKLSELKNLEKLKKFNIRHSKLTRKQKNKIKKIFEPLGCEIRW